MLVKLIKLAKYESGWVNLTNMVCFSTKKPVISEVGFDKNSIYDLKKLSYHPTHPLNFTNGKYLVYEYKPSYFGILWRSLPYLLLIGGLTYIIFYNPFIYFPAAVPISFMLNLLILWAFARRFKSNKNIIKQIYLLQNGSVTEIHYANSLQRKLFGEPLSKIYYNSLFVDPDYQKQQVFEAPNNIFPTSLPINNSKWGFAWYKYYANGQNYLIIPKKPHFIDTEILVEIFKGKVIIID